MFLESELSSLQSAIQPEQSLALARAFYILSYLTVVTCCENPGIKRANMVPLTVPGAAGALICISDFIRCSQQLLCSLCFEARPSKHTKHTFGYSAII